MPRQNQTRMLTYDLNAKGTTSTYAYLYQLIREDIAQGVIPSNTKLPSKRSLAQHLGIGVATVAAAYEQLITEGFVRSEQRRGFFVENVSQYRHRSVGAAGANCLRGGAAGAEVCAEPSRALTAAYDENADGTATAAAPDNAAQATKGAYDQDFFVDMKDNRTSIDLFPTSVWARYMREALAQPPHKLLRSVPFNGLPQLRQAIASYLGRARGMRVSPESIVIGAGSEYLYGRLLQMMGPTTTFAMENPGYKKFAAISRSYGNPWVSVPIDEAGMVVEALEDSGADVAHVSAANHFPTGVVMPITRRLELFKWAGRARKRFIIEDDYDSEFRYTGRPIMPLFADDTAGKVIYLNAFSKTMMPSLRIGYLVLPERLMQRYLDTMSFYACTVSSAEQYALARFIDEGHLERHINRMRTFYRNQRASVLKALEASPLASISAVEERNAGTHFLLHVNTRLCERDVRERGGAAGLNISMLSDYRLEGPPAAGGTAAVGAAAVGANPLTIVVNYAGISPGRVEESVRRLACIFPECQARRG